VISLVGGAALLWMAAGMLRDARGMALGPGSASAALSAWGLVGAGAAISAVNPTFPVWWATVGAGGLAQLAPRTPGEYLCFYLGHELSDFSWYGLVGLALVSGRHFLSPRLYGALVLLCGIAVMGLALWFMYTGVQVLRGRPEKESEMTIDK
jgi:threonine/homoserine/homoserine lactone efflux protein